MLKVLNISKNNNYNGVLNFKNNNVSFTSVKYKSSEKNIPLVEIPKELYYIRMIGYEQDKKWAEKMLSLTKKVSKEICNETDFNELINTIGHGVASAKQNPYYGTKRRIIGDYMLTRNSRGNEYFNKYLEKIDNSTGIYKPKSNEEYKDANVCQMYADFSKREITLCYGWRPDKKSNLGLVKKEYEKLFKRKRITLDEINKICATIKWLISQECPFMRGSDSIANVLTRAIYLSYGINPTPVKEGISLDFEAFYRDLDDFIKNYPSFFEKAPH